MPTYDLRCSACSSDFEIFVQGFLKESDRVCPECGSQKVEQRFTGFLFGSSGCGTEPCSPSVSSGGGCAASGSFG